MKSGQKFGWSKIEDAFLGVLPDAALATEFGLSRSSIMRRRMKLKIRPYQPHARKNRR